MCQNIHKEGAAVSGQVNKVVFLATMPSADVPRLQTMLGYAQAALAMGFDVVIFFTLDGAHAVKRKVFEKLDKSVRDRLEECLKSGCKVWLCSSAAATFGIRQEDVIDGVEIRGISSFYEEASKAIVLTW